MLEHDVDLLVCPHTGNSLAISDIALRDPSGEIEEGTLKEPITGRTYPIRNGIPRFINDAEYNKTWDFKWRELDQGKGHNYKIIDKSDSAYQVHDLFDRNGYGGEVYERARGKLALDVGCGVGQYSVRLMQEFEPVKLVSFDLTSGVDIFRKIIKERYPHLLSRILIVQANIFEMPFKKESFDFIMSLGVLMHTGNTRKAIRDVSDRLKVGGHINLWIYSSEDVAYTVCEADRGQVISMQNVRSLQKRYRRVERLINLFRRQVPHAATVSLLRFMSSDFMFSLMKRRGFRLIHEWMPTVVHPDSAYRLINNYDGYVNTWTDSWSEREIFPVLRERGIAIRNLADWRMGIWGIKDPDFYKR
jgi:2-polyprenyl-3-methyl-5-hydroxy-6-metoxy-1,4-benzoquinol methylase